jgi:hypothetical protein
MDNEGTADAGDQDNLDKGTGEHGAEDTGSKCPPEVQARARNMGWRPENEYTGKREWVDADAFIQNVEANLPIVVERNRFLGDELTKANRSLEDTRKKIDEMSSAMRELNEYHQRNNENAYKRARADIQREMEEAAKQGDPTTVMSKQQELDALDTQHREVSTPKPVEKKPDPAPDPATPRTEISQAAQDFINRNKKIVDDPVLYPVSVGLHQENLNAGLTEEESFEKLPAQVQALFPAKFENPRRSAPGTVRQSAPPVPPKKKDERSFDNLPAEAKAEADKLVRQIPGFTREQFVKDYQW